MWKCNKNQRFKHFGGKFCSSIKGASGGMSLLLRNMIKKNELQKTIEPSLWISA